MSTEVHSVEQVADDVARLRLLPTKPFAYRPGQYVDVLHTDGAARSYSLASLPTDGVLELHVRRLPKGHVSGWLHERQPGDTITVRGPFGQCYYLPDPPTQKLLLAGAGTGLAPLLGIVRDALQQGHAGPIDLIHGGLRPERLYLRQELRELGHESRHTHPPAKPSASAGRSGQSVRLRAPSGSAIA
ncbi:MAG: FAD-binding oxidoreductase [Planctomycetota bacterium]